MAEIRRFLENEYAKKRDRAFRDAEKRKEEVYTKIPELADIDDKITLTGINHAKAVLSENSLFSESEELSKRIDELNNQKIALLMAHGLSHNYLEPRFTCPVCNDRGYVSPYASGELVPCSCYQKLYLEQLYQVSNLLDDGKTGLEYFNGLLYSDKSDKKTYHMDISPREQIECIRHQCNTFIDEFGSRETPNLYIFGPTGTGKTFMAKSMGLELIKRGYTVLYLSATSLFSIIRQYRLTAENEGSHNEQAYKNLYTANLLILDDLGTEPGSDARYAELLTLMEMRKARDKAIPAKTIISSNLDLKRLFQEYNERIASRIVGEFSTLQFIGDDIRIIKKINNASGC